MRAIAQTITDELVQAERGMLGVMISTEDGFELCRSAAREFSDPGRLAAVSSSLLALADSSAQTAEIGASQCMVVEGSDGRVVLYAVPSLKPRLVLTVLMKGTSNLGNTIYLTRVTAMRIATAVSEAQRRATGT